MKLKDINFGDVDAKNEILKQIRARESVFFDSYSIPESIDIESMLNGSKYFILGLKGTGKTALIRYLHDSCVNKSYLSEVVLFKSHVSEEDRKNLSKGAGFNIINSSTGDIFNQDFKEAWKWLIYQRIASLLCNSGNNENYAVKLYKLTGTNTGFSFSSIASLFSAIKSGSAKLSGEAFGIAAEVGLELQKDSDGGKVILSDLNRTCSALLKGVRNLTPLYIFFDELELFHETNDQFDRDRRIIRDLIYAISHINAESAEAGRSIFLCSTLRTEVLHSVLELGHEIGRDIDDYGIRLDWSDGKDSIDHPLMRLIQKKIAVSAKISEDSVWKTFFPDNINNQEFFRFILNSSYYRPRDVVRLLRVARDFRDSDAKFSTEHFDRTSTEYSKQTWLEITEELLATYSNIEIDALQKLFLGFKTHFFKGDIIERVENRHKTDRAINDMFKKHDLGKVLSDLYRIGVVGNDFVAIDQRGKRRVRHRWVFRGNATLNDAERMAFHKSLWKHLSLVEARR
ncbi:hypothetical protein AGRHK599_LOCUS275 [Rhizobium rhizogenes]|uniref:Uncharacterized protein n=1 Tax=Rhizobium rhizogenes TaxID=359 RepID=A0AAN2DBS7_RHIRH|nr:MULTISPECIES: hypothetical protein [Rhizobium/Agrobacterium group]AQS62601.1 hypothetical protein B0909_10450 [Rhizobium rhizogenes]MCZ7441740.1 hypothetical protein [Rhizobium rhizogenes]NSZ78050.1 hypothetical protein [Agrobacterium tumefaciens]OAM64933.1 hypothetical protein A8L48_17855 [Rhizobium rhizogenes]CAD0210260.1 hypothetical protein AGRHK599_LOCUS275 [Rhizobium rhizogenes]